MLCKPPLPLSFSPNVRNVSPMLLRSRVSHKKFCYSSFTRDRSALNRLSRRTQFLCNQIRGVKKVHAPASALHSPECVHARVQTSISICVYVGVDIHTRLRSGGGQPAKAITLSTLGSSAKRASNQTAHMHTHTRSHAKKHCLKLVCKLIFASSSAHRKRMQSLSQSCWRVLNLQMLTKSKK